MVKMIFKWPNSINYDSLSKQDQKEYRNFLKSQINIDSEYEWMLDGMWWCIKVCSGMPYVALKYGTKLYYLHRLIMFSELGIVLKRNQYVDHINKNTLDNSVDNLRVGSSSDNLRNSKSNLNSVSDYKGVSPHKHKWRAQASLGPNDIRYIGVFCTEMEAAQAYDARVVEWFGETASINFPENYPQLNLSCARRIIK